MFWVFDSSAEAFKKGMTRSGICSAPLVFGVYRLTLQVKHIMWNHVMVTPCLIYVCQYYRHGEEIFFTNACSVWTLLDPSRFKGRGVLLQKKKKGKWLHAEVVRGGWHAFHVHRDILPVLVICDTPRLFWNHLFPPPPLSRCTNHLWRACYEVLLFLVRCGVMVGTLQSPHLLWHAEVGHWILIREIKGNREDTSKAAVFYLSQCIRHVIVRTPTITLWFAHRPL